MKYLNRLSACLVIAAIAVGTLAQQATPASVPSVERLRAHVEYLASDKLEGRRTGTAGANLAAQYIAREFSRYGLRRSIGHDLPGMSILEADSPNRYLQKFPYVAGVDLGEHNLFYVNPGRADDIAQYRVGEDWMPLGFSSDAQIQKAEYRFVGYGITAAEQKYDSYAGLNLANAVAVALAGTPDGDNPHGQFARYEDVRWKAIAARNAGAKGLLVVAREDNLKDDRLAQLRYDNSAGEAGLPIVVISRNLAARLFGSANDAKKTLSAMAETAQNRGVPFYPGADGSLRHLPPDTIDILGFKGVTISLTTSVVRREVSASNVVGILDGSDPTLKNEAIVIGAHYDHLGRGGAGSLASTEGGIHHGADDNASGVAGVLELARIFSQQQPRPKRTIVFMAFSGEEEGLLGSNYYVNHPILPLANTVAMINMDMIGRLKDNKLTIGGVGTAQDWREVIAAINTTKNMKVAATPDTSGTIARTSTSSTGNGVPMVTGINGRPIVTLGTQQSFDLILNEDGFGPSDHSSFYARQIPVLFFWTGTHEDYHKPSDTADKINYDGESRIVNMVADIVRNLDRSDKRPAYTVAKSEATGRSMGFRVYLGTIPNYADSTDGLLLDGVREDSPASKAGLKAGDKIVKLAGRDVKNVYDYTSALGEMKAGQEYEAEVVRAGERVTLKITPAARK